MTRERRRMWDESGIQYGKGKERTHERDGYRWVTEETQR
jgi:hypothetical protein